MNSDQVIFDAIVAAVDVERSGAIIINTKAFIERFNNHRDRKLCTSLDVTQEVYIATLFAWMNKHKNYELRFSGGGEDPVWEVHSVTGGEWTLLATGDTPEAALRTASTSEEQDK